MVHRLVPRSVKSWLKGKIKQIAAESLSVIKYLPYQEGADSYVIPKQPVADGEVCKSGFAIPPRALWLGYGDSQPEEYLASGERHVAKMLELSKQSGFTFEKGNRVLDLGCGAGRMIRHLKPLADLCEIWGTDVSAQHLFWAKQHLRPPFHFATTTTIPHLPFEDRSFSFIYCGSVFTHIDDLAEAWLCELRRVLTPEGRLYLTVHDHHTLQLLEGSYSKSSTFFAKKMKGPNPLLGDFGMAVFGRETASQVFYDDEYLTKVLDSLGFRVLSITPEAYGYQTAFLLQRN